jgi:hypothetical protein
MARQRWLVFAGCLALLRLLPACGNLCLNPQPEPPGGGCDNEMSTTGRSDGGNAPVGPDARFGVDARSSSDSAVEGGPGPNPQDAGVDQAADHPDSTSDAAPFDSSDGSNDMSVDSSGDGDAAIATDGPGEGAVDVADGAADGASSDAQDDGASDDAQDDGPKDALDVVVRDGTAPD